MTINQQQAALCLEEMVRQCQNEGLAVVVNGTEVHVCTYLELDGNGYFETRANDKALNATAKHSFETIIIQVHK